MKAWVAQTLRYRGEYDLEDEITKWTEPKFPINGLILRELGVEGMLAPKFGGGG